MKMQFSIPLPKFQNLKCSKLQKFFQDVLSGRLQEGSLMMCWSHCAADAYNCARRYLSWFDAKHQFVSSSCYKVNYNSFVLDLYECLCIIKVYRIGIPKSETLSSPSILDKGYRTVNTVKYDTVHDIIFLKFTQVT
jgi:ribosome-interacting GTPase 1